MLERVAHLPARGERHRAPTPQRRGAAPISANDRIAFATVVFDEKANLLPKSAGEQVVRTARAAAEPGLQVELGGQAIEQTEQSGLRHLDGGRPDRGDRRAADHVRLAHRDGPADRRPRCSGSAQASA